MKDQLFPPFVFIIDLHASKYSAHLYSIRLTSNVWTSVMGSLVMIYRCNY